MIPTPKFDIGDRVFSASVRQNTKDVTCPDCNGSKYLDVHTHDGRVFLTECCTCKYGYECRGFLRETLVETVVEYLTIGSVRLDTDSEDDPVSYMCHETGVGSGQIWYESRLSLIKEEAIKVAEDLTGRQQVVVDQREVDRVERNRKTEIGKPYGGWQKSKVLFKAVQDLLSVVEYSKEKSKVDIALTRAMSPKN